MIRRFASAVCCIFVSGLVLAGNTVQVRFLPASDSETQAIKQVIEQSPLVQDVIELMRERYRLSERLTIQFGGDDDPAYDEEAHTILISYDFFAEAIERFENANYAETGVTSQNAALDVLAHTLLHEFGHAIISMNKLPVVAKEEDAADSLATLLLIERFEHGQDIALSAADMFALESEDYERLEEPDFWDEHSLDAQRYYTTLCHIYGSDPDKYADLMEEVDIDQDRRELCIDEYDVLTNSWNALLAPYLQDSRKK
ncbi:DUF4344 domain-containing metallopeptidase [Kistimonas scapharcae]|uniref:DUF4344 domain-containing metallopeptidase n=1 Tax=Kistimonas scapharcae TaxID=1036133 RepID=UPI0031EE3AB2